MIRSQDQLTLKSLLRGLLPTDRYSPRCGFSFGELAEFFRQHPPAL